MLEKFRRKTQHGIRPLEVVLIGRLNDKPKYQTMNPNRRDLSLQEYLINNAGWFIRSGQIKTVWKNQATSTVSGIVDYEHSMHLTMVVCNVKYVE